MADTDDKGKKDGETSSDSKSKSSDTKKTYSEAEVQKLLDTKHSKLDIEIDRLTKENRRLKPFEQAAGDAEAEVGTLRGDLRKVKAEVAKQDPDLLSLFQSEVELEAQQDKLKKERQKLDAEKAEAEDDIRDAKTNKHEKAVKAAAKEAGVSEDLLLSVVPKPYEGLDIDEIAKKMPKAEKLGDESGDGDDDDETEEDEDNPWSPDSGQTTGGAAKVTDSALQKAADAGDMDTYSRLRAKQEKENK